jgi:hypothetical protein
MRSMTTRRPFTTSHTRLLGITAAAVSLLSVPSMTLAAPTQSQGLFVDGAGGRHSWTINKSHTLLWDDKPFLPVGGLFQVQSWGPNTTDADFAADKAALAEIKARGVKDVILQPTRGGITALNPETIQRVLDYLDSEGFTYGLSLNDGPREPLSAFEVRPGAYRQMTPEGGSTLRFPIENLASSLYFIVAPTGSELVTSGNAQMTPDGVKIDTPALNDKMVAFLVPEKLYFANSPMGVPNLWDGYDSYRDSLLSLFSKVHLGKGFRFFVDALPPSLDLTDEAMRILPNSPGFTAEWGAYLARKYRTLETLDSAWNITERNVPSFDAASALLPLWNGGKGVSLFYDRKTKTAYKTDYTRSLFWTDLRAFMTDSVRGYMNDLAIALKHGVADVPVVYRSHKTSLLFSQLASGPGFDGIGVDAYGRGRDLIATGGAGEVYAQASEANRTIWLPITATSDAGPLPATKTAKGYGSRTALVNDFNWLRDIGGRGFYVDSLRTLDPARTNFNLAALPDQLTWLSDYQGMLEAGATSSGPLTTLPGVTYYPRSLAGASIKLLPGGEWWLPTERPYLQYDFGTSGSAYALTEPDGSTTYYLWNPSGGTRTIRLELPPQTTKLKDAPKVQWSATANGAVKKNVLTLTIGPDPIRLLNYPTVPLPMDAFDESMDEATKLYAVMKEHDSLERGLLGNINLPQLKLLKEKRDPWYAYAQLQDNLARMRAVVRDYAWLQAEGDDHQSPTSQSFDAIEEKQGASNGRVLVVGKRAPGMPIAVAQYSVMVNTAGTFQLCVGASPNAPLTFRIDGQPVINNEVAHSINLPGASYAGGDLVWIDFGPITLPAGQHTLELRASGPAMVDTVLLHKGNFVPNGPNPPSVLP